MTRPHPLAPAIMISPDDDAEGAPLLRTAFALTADHGRLLSAVLTATALGIVELEINGAPVGPDVLTPGWSSYPWRIRYRRWDVTTLLPGRGEQAVLGAALGNGWYRGRLGVIGGGRPALYGDQLGVIAHLDLHFADGHHQTVITDEQWQSGPSQTTMNQLYDGQTVDFRRPMRGWSAPGFDTAGWSGVHRADFDPDLLTAPIGPPVVRHETRPPARILTSPSGKTLIDFGQNLVGWVRGTVTGTAGAELVIKHAEVLEDGELATRPLRTAAATDRYILSGAADFFEPSKTFHGFRYAEIQGWPGELTLESARASDLVAVVVGSDLRRTGRFACSEEMINQLHSNIVWSQRGNFLDLPTDCPQRDERLGWTGDIAAFAPTATFLFDVKDFLADWLADLAAEQQANDGRVPFMIPDVVKYQEDWDPDELGAVTAIWGDASVWVPWAVYEAYGDEAVLRDQYLSMTAHVRHIEAQLSPTGLWDTGFQFADWMDPDAPAADAGGAKADKGVVATACAFRSATLMARVAATLQRGEDHQHFAALAARIRTAFSDHYVAPDGLIRSDCATVYALAIHFGLVDGSTRARAGDRLAEIVRRTGFRVSTGFAGTPFVTWALSSTGHVDSAYRLLLERGCPSWLYPVTMGATTVWERWDALLPDGSINEGDGTTMSSFNHYALGAVADWLHQVVGGISAAAPGFSRVTIAPQPGPGITWADTELITAHGAIASRWRIEGGRFELEVRIPPDCHAEVHLPDGSRRQVTAGDHQFSVLSA